MKKFLLAVILVMTLFIYSPVKAQALTVYNSPLMFAKTTSIEDAVTSSYNQTQSCTGGNSILGNPNDTNSVAWLLNKILTYATIAGVALVVVLSSIDFLSVIAKSDDDSMGKAKKKLIIRLILAALLMFIPTITSALLSLFGLTSESTCGIGQ